MGEQTGHIVAHQIGHAVVGGLVEEGGLAVLRQSDWWTWLDEPAAS